MLDRHLQAGIGVVALLLGDVEGGELHVRDEPEQQRHLICRRRRRAWRLTVGAAGSQDQDQRDERGGDARR
jgi:hypothetical protein